MSEIMGRRDYKSGSITARKNNKGEVTGYQAQIRLADGRRSHTALTEREARKWLREAKDEAARGRLATKRPPTFAAYLADWVASMSGKVKSRTVASYRLNTERVPEWLGGQRLDELRPRHFQRLYDELTDAGKAPRTVRQVHAVLHKALDDALQLESINHNPTEGARLPRIPEKEMQWYSSEQVAVLFDVTEGDDFHALWVLLGTLGLRLGEALGLKWTDINWDRNTLTVQRTLHRDRLSHGLEMQEPKTKGSRRTLTLPTEAKLSLQAHHDRQDLKRRMTGEVWEANELIFSTGMGTPLDQSHIRRHWTSATKKAGLPQYRIHDLRHSVASNLVAGGMGLLEVAHLLGHSNAAMVVQVYGHIAPDDHRRAASLMDALLQRQDVEKS